MPGFSRDRFDYGILKLTDHRPWRLPRSPWVMTQTWHNLLFAHWRVDRSRLRSLVPSTLELDTWNGDAWLGIVPFVMTNVAPRGVPAIPWLSTFAELNVRTYVRHRGRRGVYFFSLDAASPVAVQIARTLFGLPYFRASMQVIEAPSGVIGYRSERTDHRGGAAVFAASYGPVAAPSPPAEGSLEHFLTERYCLYTVDPRGRPWTVDIHHPPWPLQTADAEVRVNTMAAATGLQPGDEPPLLHFAKRQDVVAWRPRAA